MSSPDTTRPHEPVPGRHGDSGSSSPRAQVERVLLVEDNERLRRALTDELRTRYPQVEACSNVEDARRLLVDFAPGLIIMDVELPDGTALDVVAGVEGITPTPIMIAMSGVARPEQTFELAKRGVRAFLDKPVTMAELELAVQEALERPPDIQPFVKALVGKRSVHDVEAQVRATMVDEAMARSRGSRRGAARLLSISRQLLQHILKRFER